MKKVIIITGPTAIGKTKLSIEIAKKLNTPLINGDAYQIYKGLDILTAKPSKKEREEVKHYLIDELDPFKPYSIYQYQKMVRDLINQIDIPIIVGGSGLYIDSVIYDYRFESDENKNKFDDSQYSNEELHNILKELDIEKANTIHQNNRKRVVRAIELSTFQDKEERNKNHQHVYEPLIICLSLDRDILYDRINQRTYKMIEEGMIVEIQNQKNLVDTQLGKAIGYLDTLKYLNGLITKEELIEKIQKDSRHYAKRQLTWYRNHQDCKIVNVNLQNFDETINHVLNLINDFIIN